MLKAINQLRFASFLGDNAFEFYRQVVAYVGTITGFSTELISGLSPDAQETMVRQEEIQVVFTCGLPYVRKADHKPPLLCLIAAPVLAAPRYQNRPIYFSDVIVRADAPYKTFGSLRGATFAYNEIYSLSGYLSVCYHLLALGEIQGFFGKTLRSGAHAISMDWVEAGHVDAAAIDSVVLEMEITQQPERAGVFRVIECLGPAPMPPVAAVTGLADNVCERLKDALLDMHTTKPGQAMLRQAGVQCFVEVNDGDYDPIRHMLQTLPEGRLTEFR